VASTPRYPHFQGCNGITNRLCNLQRSAFLCHFKCTFLLNVVRLFLGPFTTMLQNAPVSFAMTVCLSVRLSVCDNSLPVEWTFMKSGIGECYYNLSKHYNFEDGCFLGCSAV
jgi:hypothetical protein